MPIRLQNPADWQVFKPGQGIQLPGDKTRRILLEVNCLEPACFHLDSADLEAPFFLGEIKGYETLEWIAEGECQVTISCEGDVWLYTAEMEVIAFDCSESESFTNVEATRMTESEKQQAMLMVALENSQRRQDQLADEIAQVRAMRQAYEREQEDGEDGAGDTQGNAGPKGKPAPRSKPAAGGAGGTPPATPPASGDGDGAGDGAS